MTIKTFVKLPAFRFGIHVFLLAGIFFNIVQLYRIHRVQGLIEEDELVLSLLEDANNESKNNKDYYNSELFKEKYAKEKAYKIRGERVLDTSSIEGDNEASGDEYIPEEDEDSKPNYQKWLEYFIQF